MILVFGAYEIDPQRGELRKDGIQVSVETRVLNLLNLLVRNHDRLIPKEEIVEVVWDGRAISDSAISTSIKEARKAVGDDGNRQSVIKTVHGRGFRCVADVRIKAAAKPAADNAVAREIESGEAEGSIGALAGKPSIAVLPFHALSTSDLGHAIADAVPAELISALSRLRWMGVIARGSSFRFRGPDVQPQTVRQILKVGYCLTGVVELLAPSLMISVELVETAEGSVIWGEQYSSTVDDVHDVRSKIVAGVIAALEVHVPLNEASLARLLPPQSLDAWSAFHLGVQHMYRFNRADNEIATGYFNDAISEEPGFARAHAGLSFTSFQNAFMNYVPDRAGAIDEARRRAEKSLELDLLDPFGNYNMGRVSWLVGDVEGGSGWLDRSLQISPNFAQGHYVKALMDVMAGRPQEARESSSKAMALSPLDPLFYAMLGTHAQSYLSERNFAEAAAWAERAARAPGSHHFLATIAAVANQLNGDQEKAAHWARNVLSRRPDMRAENFFHAFPFADPRLSAELSRALEELGF